MDNLQGLSTELVGERRAAGLRNDVALETSRRISGIIRHNAFNPVNILLYAISLGLALAGDLTNALSTVGLVALNAAIGIVQEIRAKRQLDRIALLARGKITVRRDGKDQEVLPEDLVLGDLLVIRSGDQIPVDGTVISDDKLEMDESSLTGESDLVTKLKDDQILSGTICMGGYALVTTTNVGEASFANTITKTAREFTFEMTPLQRSTRQLLQVVLLVVMFFVLVAVMALLVSDFSLSIWLQILAVVTGSVSAGLPTLITLNYSWGAVRIGRAGGLVQQINAIESLSNITVLCTDKTGTLTANRILFNAIHPVGLDQHALESRLADFAASASDLNKTSAALHGSFAGTRQAIVDEVPFSSERKWSALACDDPAAGRKGVYVLGAQEMLHSHLSIDETSRQQIEEWSNSGLRVLVFADNPDVTTLHDAQGAPTLPPLRLLGIVSFSDELRPHLRETISAFIENGVKLKVISGDSPQTVAALARQAGLPGDLRAVSGAELDAMSEAEFAATAAEATVFGRIAPGQKAALVEALRKQGEYVAMLGDGVNDVLSLKKANLGIAMESGSTATRSVAAIILLGDSFEVLPIAFREGIRIVNSIQEVLKLFMATVFSLLLLVVGITMLGIGFPFTAMQSLLLSVFVRGVPPLILSLASESIRRQRSLMRGILQFTLPASLSLLLFSLPIYLAVYILTERQLIFVELTAQEIARFSARNTGLVSEQVHMLARVPSAQTALTTFSVLSGVLLMVFARPPVHWLAAGDFRSGGKWLPTVAAGMLILAYSVMLLSPTMRGVFELVRLPMIVNLGIVGMVFFWSMTLLFFWRKRLLERFLGINTTENGQGA
jgi:cation-transporting P-type ATPase E